MPVSTSRWPSRRRRCIPLGYQVWRDNELPTHRAYFPGRASKSQRVVLQIDLRYMDSMIEDQEIWACANELMKQHGADAWFVASQRADELLAEGQLEGSRTFVRILNRIKQLEALTPSGRSH
jgi:hypothetical protein